MINSFNVFSTVYNFDTFTGIPCHGATLLHLPDNIHTMEHVSEHHVFTIQPRGLVCADEEL